MTVCSDFTGVLRNFLQGVLTQPRIIDFIYVSCTNSHGTFLPTALQSPSDQRHWLLVFLWTLCGLPLDLHGRARRDLFIYTATAKPKRIQQKKLTHHFGVTLNSDSVLQTFCFQHQHSQLGIPCSEQMSCAQPRESGANNNNVPNFCSHGRAPETLGFSSCQVGTRLVNCVVAKHGKILLVFPLLFSVSIRLSCKVWARLHNSALWNREQLSSRPSWQRISRVNIQQLKAGRGLLIFKQREALTEVKFDAFAALEFHFTAIKW